MNEEAEERRLPASDKKIREARKKGQVSQSRDLVSGFTLFGALIFLYLFWPVVWERLDKLVEVISNPAGGPTTGVVAEALRHSVVLTFLATAPLAGIVVVLTFVFGVIGTFGPVFSFDTVKPRFEHVNPVQGLKKIFSLRNVIEFTKSLVKLILLGTLFVFVLLAWLQPLFTTPACGPSCMEPMVMSMLIPFGATAAAAFVVIGILDVPIQRWLFLRDMRMTRSEYRREHKDLEGDPLIRQELRRQRQEAVSQPMKLGLRNAVLVVTGGDQLVALRYVKGETPIPAVVAKGQGAAAEDMASEARRLGIPLVIDPSLAGPLFENTRNGAYIGQDLFTPVVRHLVRLGLT